MRQKAVDHAGQNPSIAELEEALRGAEDGRRRCYEELEKLEELRVTHIGEAATTGAIGAEAAAIKIGQEILEKNVSYEIADRKVVNLKIALAEARSREIEDIARRVFADLSSRADKFRTTAPEELRQTVQALCRIVDEKNQINHEISRIADFLPAGCKALSPIKISEGWNGIHGHRPMQELVYSLAMAADITYTAASIHDNWIPDAVKDALKASVQAARASGSTEAAPPVDGIQIAAPDTRRQIVSAAFQPPPAAPETETPYSQPKFVSLKHG